MIWDPADTAHSKAAIRAAMDAVRSVLKIFRAVSWDAGA